MTIQRDFVQTVKTQKENSKKIHIGLTVNRTPIKYDDNSVLSTQYSKR